MKSAEDVAGEAYQVIGAIAATAGIFDSPEVQAALDYFSSDLTGEILPFTPPPAGQRPADLRDPDNPEWTEADFARARPAREVFSEAAIRDFEAKGLGTHATRSKPSE